MAVPSAKLGERVREGWKVFTGWPYLTVLIGIACLAPIYLLLIPQHYFLDNWAANARALGLAFLCGALVGVTEIASRYRDEQIKAISSPDGLVYIVFNGAISTFALILIWHFRNNPAFSFIKNEPLGAAIAAGFGATAIMRTRLAVIKGSDNKDVSIGPDIILSLLMTMIDRRIDRWRSLKRGQIIAESFSDLRALGTIGDAGDYLLASLNSFQNLSETDKKEINGQVKQNAAAEIHDPYIKLTTLGYIFLTFAGEQNFRQVLEKAKDLQHPQIRASNILTLSPAATPSPSVAAPPTPTPLVGTQVPPVPPNSPPPTP
jgi:hypothetical protein